MESTSLVSIIVNCFNGDTYLKDCLDSIVSQTYTNWEIIFWDNQSSDKSAQIFKSYEDSRFRYFYSPSFTNLYTARNLALEKSKGEYIAFLDVDDYWIEEKLELQINSIKKDSAEICAGNYFEFYQESNNKIEIRVPNLILSEPLKNLLISNYIGMFTILISKAVLEEIKPAFNNKYHIIGDFDMLVRVLMRHKISWIDKPIGTYRIHGENESIKKKDLQLKEEIIWMTDRNNELISNIKEFTTYKNLRWYMYISSKRINLKELFKTLALIDSNILKIKATLKWLTKFKLR